MKEIIRHGFVFGIRPGSRNGGAGSNYRMPILGELECGSNESGRGCDLELGGSTSIPSR